ncbi:alpha-d-galacturonidase [Arachidicoccus sp.]|uniref:alpha-d-galacturonidase n=1 Tax=Arachidicoccus sp. TaxID=1872624 RepID=UPI003D1C568D
MRNSFTSLFTLIFTFVGSLSFAQKGPKNFPKNCLLVENIACPDRVQFGIQKLADALTDQGFKVKLVHKMGTEKLQQTAVIYISQFGKPMMHIAEKSLQIHQNLMEKKEAFHIVSDKKNEYLIVGSDSSGVLYGCLELADRLKKLGHLPASIDFQDQPQMVLRGACIGLQKTTLLPGRGTYEYPITPQNFPWFYNKKLWIKYLNMLVENRMNTLYLWSGHPFASLVRLKKYPYAVEVDSATFLKNEAMYKFLTHEADKRGIWVIQAFYNIIVSKPFAERHHIKTQDRSRPIIPLIADYTRRSIAAFVEKYPNVGLLVTLGEAMQGSGPDDVNWFSKTIIPGVKDGLKALGKTQEPPIILRAHDTNAPDDLKAAKKVYSNLFTMAKYNGEALTTYEPRGSWAALHKELSEISPVLVENVHIMANLEPFRYGADDFIQKCVQAMHKIDGANGLHLYPQASYWDWPYAADKADPRLLEMDRDWIWYAEWSRYAWNCDRSRSSEFDYWSGKLADKYGCNIEVAKSILTAYEQSGEIAPKLLRRYGITDGNRQTLTLGMFMSELIHPTKYGLFTLLYSSESPKGEMLTEYAKKDWLHQPHMGETPTLIAKEVIENGRNAVNAINAASPYIKKDTAEFNRLKNDIYSYNLLANFYSQKAKAALCVLRYKYSNNISDLEKALPYLESSVQYFSDLAMITKNTYLYANSMQTSQRKIPISGKDGKNKTWVELLPLYQKELANFKKNIQALKFHKNIQSEDTRSIALQNASVNFLDGKTNNFIVVKNARPFLDTAVGIEEVAPVLRGLKALSFSRINQQENGTLLHFKNDKKVQLLIGYFVNKSKTYLSEPELETDASANEYGQAETKIANAVLVPGFPSVNVHSFSFAPGEHSFQLGDGECLVLGFIDGNKKLVPYDAALGTNGEDKDLDWLFQ